MRIEYEISEQDFLDAQKLAMRNLPKRTTRWIFRILPFWGLFLLLGVIGWPVYQGSLVWKTELAVPVGFAILCLLSPWLLKIAQKKAYRKNPALHGKRTMEVTQTGLNFSGTNYSSQLKWDFFIKYVEDEKVFVLYQSNQIFHPIPKRTLSADEVSVLREAFKQNIAVKN